MSRLQHAKYVEISHAIEARIRSVALDRARMPSVRSMAEEFGVSISLAPGQKPMVLEQSAGLSDKQTFRELADCVLGLQADGVVCYEGYMAMGLILELLARGVRVPADVAVTGFDDMPIGNSFAIGVTTYALAGEDVARQASRLMRERVRHPGQRSVRVHVPGELIVRESTGGVGNHSRSEF